MRRVRKELVDQLAHAGAAYAMLQIAELLLGAQLGLAGGAWLGFCLGLVRELTEEDEITLKALRHALGSRLDLTFWTLGGLAAGC